MFWLKDVSIIVSITWDRVSVETIKNFFTKALEPCNNYSIADLNDDPSDEAIFEFVTQTIEEIVDDNSESSDSNETFSMDGMSNELKSAVNTLKVMDRFTRSLAPDSLKHFY